MLRLNLFFTLFAFAFLLTSCESDEDIDPKDTKTSVGTNEVVFDDDNMVCTAYSSNPSINAQGILSLVMNPCQNSGSKLDGYFKYGNRPTAGTYTVVGTAGSFPNTIGMGETEYSMVFYGHGSEALYSTSGTIELTVNADDDTKLDMNWTDVTMEGTETSVKFSGSFTGL